MPFQAPRSNFKRREKTVPLVPSFMSKSPVLIALDFHPCVMNLVLRDGLKSEPARFVVSFRVIRVPSCGPDLKRRLWQVRSNIRETVVFIYFFVSCATFKRIPSVNNVNNLRAVQHASRFAILELQYRYLGLPVTVRYEHPVFSVAVVSLTQTALPSFRMRRVPQ